MTGEAVRSVCLFTIGTLRSPRSIADEAFLRDLALRHDITVVSCACGPTPEPASPRLRFVRLPRIPLLPVRVALLTLLGPIVLARVVLRRRIDVIVAACPYDGLIAAAARLLCSAFGRRPALIVEAHTDVERAFFLYHRTRLEPLLRPLLLALSRRGLAVADAVRVVSEATERQVRGLVPGAEVVRVAPPIAIDIFSEAAGAAQGGSRKDLLFAGVVSRIKGIDLLVEAFLHMAPRFPKARLHVCGRETDPALSRLLRERIMVAGCSDRVLFHGHVDQPTLASHMARSLALVLPSRSEAYGRTLVEAMAAGTAVIGAAVGGIGEIVRDGETGWLVPPEDVDALAAAIEAALGDPAEALRRGELGRRSVLSLGVQATGAGSYLELMQTAVAARAQKPARARLRVGATLVDVRSAMISVRRVELCQQGNSPGEGDCQERGHGSL